MGLFGKNEEKRETTPTIELKPEQMVPAAPPPPQTKPKSPYSVQDAIALMRKLPSDPASLPLVVQVVRSTLASMNVRVEDIVDDATQRQKGIEDRIIKIRAAISDLEKEIATRRHEIAEAEADLAETVSVRERLQLTEAPTPAPSPVVTAAAPASAPKPRPSPATSNQVAVVAKPPRPNGT
jgi:hypothetical protein